MKSSYLFARKTFWVIFFHMLKSFSAISSKVKRLTSDLKFKSFSEKPNYVLHLNKSVFYLGKLRKPLVLFPLDEIRPECHLEGWTWAKKKTPHHFWHLMITPYRNFPSNSLLHKKQSKIGFAFAGFPRRSRPASDWCYYAIFLKEDLLEYKSVSQFYQ